MKVVLIFHFGIQYNSSDENEQGLYIVDSSSLYVHMRVHMRSFIKSKNTFLFKILGIIPVLIGLLFSVTLISTGSYFLYQTLMGNDVPTGDIGPGLFMITELGTLPNPVALIINLSFLWLGLFLLKSGGEGFLQDYFSFH